MKVKRTNWKNGRCSALKGVEKSEDTKKKLQESSHKKQVVQKNLNGDVLGHYNSLSSVSRETGVNLGNISSCCNGRVNTAGGFIWEFD